MAREKEKKVCVKYNGLHALATLERATVIIEEMQSQRLYQCL